MQDPYQVYSAALIAALALTVLAVKLAKTALKLAVVSAAIGTGLVAGVPEIQERVENMLPEPTATLKPPVVEPGTAVSKVWIELPGFEITEAMATAFSTHFAAGLAAMALVYVAMEVWYPAAFVVAPAEVLAVVWADEWLIQNYLVVTGSEFHSLALTAGSGFVLGAILLAVLFEPEFSKGSENKSIEDSFERLNL